MKDNTNSKRNSPRPADPVILKGPNAGNGEILELPPAKVETTGAAAKEQSELKLQAFPDGHIFLWTHHPTEAGKFVLFNTANEPVAVTQSAPIADLLCSAVRMLFQAVAASKRQPVETRPDTEATRAEDTQIDQEHAAELAEEGLEV